jgi:hypothetical protein
VTLARASCPGARRRGRCRAVEIEPGQPRHRHAIDEIGEQSALFGKKFGDPLFAPSLHLDRHKTIAPLPILGLPLGPYGIH